MKNLFNRSILFAAVVAMCVACNSNEPEKAFVGVWSPCGYEMYDKFVITSDSIKAIGCEDSQEHYQAHYKMLRDSVALLERCWMEVKWQGFDSSNSDWHPEEYFFAEVKMYIDKDGYLIIRPFDLEDYLSQKYPNYSELKLRRYENN